MYSKHSKQCDQNQQIYATVKQDVRTYLQGVGELLIVPTFKERVEHLCLGWFVFSQTF